MKRQIMYWFLLATITLWAPHAEAQVPQDQLGKIRQAAPDKARVAPKAPRKVLVWNTPPAFMDKDPHKGYCIPYGEAAMKILGEKTGAFTAVVSDDVAVYLPESLDRFDAIIMNNSSNAWIRPTEADMVKFKDRATTIDDAEQLLRKSLLDYVTRGGGIVAYHYAIGANAQWPEFRQLLGAKFDGHPWNEEVGVKVEEPDSPLVAAWGGKDFRFHDEIFQYTDPYDRSKLRVLLSLDTSKTNMTVPWINRKDGDFALAWVKHYGKGRIFYTSFGHRTECYFDPRLLQFYLDAIQYVCGDLDAKLKPRS
jgi:type 1 glutamine amidotransferase